MSAMTERIGLVCHACEYDLPDSEHYPLYLMWLESVSRWGVESPPAMGCLLELVRAAWGDDEASASPSGTVRRWQVEIEVDGTPLTHTDDGEFPFGDTEADALVEALEAAP